MTEDQLIYFNKEYVRVRELLIQDDSDITLFTNLFDSQENFEKLRLLHLSVEISAIKALRYCLYNKIKFDYINHDKHSIIYQLKRNIYNYCRKPKENYKFLARKIDFLKHIELYFKDHQLHGDEDIYNFDKPIFRRYIDKIEQARKIKVINDLL